jgi:hypothetical protein
VHAQQACDTSVRPLSSPTAKFVLDDAEGVATDGSTHLMWLRCAAGQAWRGKACAGTASKHAWEGAQTWAQEVNRMGTFFYNDWRLPTLPELATVTERQCINPRINLAVFPSTPSATFWTTTQRPQQAGDVYVLDFASGGVEHDVKTAGHYVRLVRNSP